LAGIKVDVKVDDKVLKSVLGKIGKLENYIVSAATVDVFNYARMDVPVDTGALKASIYRRVSGNTGYVGSSMPYAGFVEMGTRKMRAQPYLRPALNKVKWDKIVRLAFKFIGL